MPTLPSHVEPGDVISSDLINAILDELARLGGLAQSGGSQAVPNLMGVLLGDARTSILQPDRRLSMGFTLDVTGAAVDPLLSANTSRVVLNQYPPANSLVVPSTPVNLIVSASLGAGGPIPTPDPPNITGTETPGGGASTSFAAGSDMVLVGTDFSAIASQNQVTVGGIQAVVASDPGNVTLRLIVTIPQTVAPGSNVPVVLTVGPGLSDTTNITVTEPAANQPRITGVSPNPALEGQPITIEGDNLGAVTGATIRGQDVGFTFVPPRQITTTVPQFGNVLVGQLVDAPIVLSGDGVDDESFNELQIFGVNPA